VLPVSVKKKQKTPAISAKDYLATTQFQFFKNSIQNSFDLQNLNSFETF
jgi:hypothetical protein